MVKNDNLLKHYEALVINSGNKKVIENKSSKKQRRR